MKSSNRAQRYRKTYDAFLVELGQDSLPSDRTLLSAATILTLMQEDQIDAYVNGDDAALESALEIGDALLNTLEVVGLIGSSNENS
jgi:hypothetical protein